jgi:hypothetical protein
MKRSLRCQLFLLGCTASASAQDRPKEVVRCAPDSIVENLRQRMKGLQFKRDSSDVEFVPDSGSSDLAVKARIITDAYICRRAHAVFVRDAPEDAGPPLVALARVGSFYFIYENDGELLVVDRNWKHVTLLGYGL